MQPARDLPVHTINAVVHAGEPLLIEASTKGASAGNVHTELRIVRPDTGEVRWLVKRGEYLRDAETAGLRFSGVIYDITNSKRVEETLRTLNDTWRRASKNGRASATAYGGFRETCWLFRRQRRLAQRQSGMDTAFLAGDRMKSSAAPPVGSSIRTMRTAVSLPLDASDGASASFQTRLRTRQGDYRSLAWTAVSQGGTHLLGRA